MHKKHKGKMWNLMGWKAREITKKRTKSYLILCVENSGMIVYDYS